MVVFTLDSASRVGVLSGRGMFEMIRTDIGAWLAWFIFAPTLLVNVIVNMSQMSAMVEGTARWHAAAGPVKD
jgi:Mn2+/Fe2+ NRAMP family transporter